MLQCCFGLMFSIGITITSETATCHQVNPPPAGSVKNQRLDNPLAFRTAKSAREIDDETDQQNQAKPAAADDGTAKIKSSAAEQEQQDHHE
jgi:hypothetical protein